MGCPWNKFSGRRAHCRTRRQGWIHLYEAYFGRELLGRFDTATEANLAYQERYNQDHPRTFHMTRKAGAPRSDVIEVEAVDGTLTKVD